MLTLKTPKSALFGHLPLVNPKTPMQSLTSLAQEHGGLFEMKLGKKRALVISDPDIVTELSDPKRFEKLVTPPLQSLRKLAGDGLFTAETNEPNWGRAHRILAPAFTRRAVRDYHPAMRDVSLQLANRWARRNPGETVDVTADMTRLTLETIGLCGFGYRFHNFERDQPHPFVKAMMEALDESLSRLFRFPWDINPIRKACHHRNLKYLNDSVDKILHTRRESQVRRPDLLDRMLWEVDPKTGQPLDDENIRRQILTFLVAGHETTSGLLSFALHALGRHRYVYHKAVQEALSVGETPTFEEIQNCRYIRAVLQETLRLWPTAPSYGVRALKPTTINGDIEVTPDDDLLVMLTPLHRHPSIWSEPETFDPDRFLTQCPHRHRGYRPFGSGKRSCIGQSFALHESILCLVVLLQKVELGPVTEPLEIQESLTLKPRDFQLQVWPRRETKSAAS
jgi:cytochrome P450/NADPH-cytochrome P450 reductase